MSRTSKPKTGLGKRLKKLREQKGQTQQQLASKLEFAVASISRWEREDGSPQAEQLYLLAKYFDVSLDYLMFGTDTSSVSNVHSPQLHKFLATTAAGKWAREHKPVLEMLLNLRYPEPTVELYRSVTNAVRSHIEAASDEESPTSDGQKPPTK